MAGQRVHWVGHGRSGRWQDAGNWAGEPGGHPGHPAPREGQVAVLDDNSWCDVADLYSCPAAVEISGFTGKVRLPDCPYWYDFYVGPWWKHPLVRLSMLLAWVFASPRVSRVVGRDWRRKVQTGAAVLCASAGYKTAMVMPRALGGVTTYYFRLAGNWNDGNTWSLTDGGGAAGSFPVAGDIANITALSPAATLTVNVASACDTLTINNVGATVLHNAGTTLTGAMTLTTGTLNTNGQTCSWLSLAASNANVRTVSFGASAITITGTSSQALNFSTTSNLTMTANTATVTMTGTAAGASFGGPKNYNGLSLVMTGAGNMSITTGSQGSTLANFTRTGTAVKTDGLSSAGSGLICTGTITFGGNSTQGVNRLIVQGVIGVQQTYVAAAYVISKDVDFLDTNLTYSGAPSWTNTASNFVGDAGNNAGAVTTNATVAATQTATGIGSLTWSTHGWTSRVPLPQDAVVINNAFVGSPTVTQDMPRAGKSISVGSTGNFTFTAPLAWSLYGNLTLAPVSGTMTWTSGGIVLTLAGRGAQTITTNGIAVGNNVTVNAGGGSYTLQDNLALNVARPVTLSSGTLIDNGKTVTAQAFVSTGALSRTATLTGTWNLAGTGTLTVWNVANVGTLLTLTATAATLNITSTDNAVTKTFAGGGGTYGTLAHTSTGSAGLTITGNNTLAALNLGDTTARTVTLPASGTQTVTGTGAGALTFAGASGQNISFVSSSPGTATTIVAQPCAYSLTFYTFSADIVFSVLYRKLAVTYVSSNGTLSTVAADTVFTFAPSGSPGSLAVADHYADAGSVGTTETDIFSDSIAAGRLATNGDKLIATYAGTCGGAASATKTLRAYFGGTVIFSSGALSFGGNSDWEITVTVIRVSSSVVRCIVALTTTGASGATYSQYTQVTGLTLANAQTMKMTGQSGGVGSADNDVTGKLSTVEYVTAAV